VLRRRPSLGLRDPHAGSDRGAAPAGGAPVRPRRRDRGHEANLRARGRGLRRAARQRVAQGAARVLVLVDTFACPCFALSLSSRCSLLSCLRAESLCAVRTTRANPCMVELDSTVPEPCGAIGETEGPSRWRRKGSFSKVGVPW